MKGGFSHHERSKWRGTETGKRQKLQQTQSVLRRLCSSSGSSDTYPCTVSKAVQSSWFNANEKVLHNHLSWVFTPVDLRHAGVQHGWANNKLAKLQDIKHGGKEILKWKKHKKKKRQWDVLRVATRVIILKQSRRKHFTITTAWEREKKSRKRRKTRGKRESFVVCSKFFSLWLVLKVWH